MLCAEFVWSFSVCVRSIPGQPPAPLYWPVTSVLIITPCWHSPPSPEPHVPALLASGFRFCLFSVWVSLDCCHRSDKENWPIILIAHHILSPYWFLPRYTFCLCQFVWREAELSYTCCRSSFSADCVATCIAGRTHSRTTFVANTFFPNILTSPTLSGWSPSPSWTIHDHD